MYKRQFDNVAAPVIPTVLLNVAAFNTANVPSALILPSSSKTTFAELSPTVIWCCDISVLPLTILATDVTKPVTFNVLLSVAAPSTANVPSVFTAVADIAVLTVVLPRFIFVPLATRLDWFVAELILASSAVMSSLVVLFAIV